MSRRTLLGRSLLATRPPAYQPRPPRLGERWLRPLSTTRSLGVAELRSVDGLPERTVPRYLQSTRPGSSLLSLKWPRPPRNLLLVQKLYSEDVTQSVVKFARYIRSEYPEVNVIVEPRVATSIQEQLSFPVYVSDSPFSIADKIDAIATFGGDGTVLRAASLFKLHGSVPPILSFSMGDAWLPRRVGLWGAQEGLEGNVHERKRRGYA